MGSAQGPLIGPLRSSRRRPRVTAELVRSAALTLFAEKGYRATSLRDIAAAVGVQAGSLYNHITSKDELLFSLLCDSISDRLHALRQATVAVEDPIERLRIAIDVVIRHRFEEHREIFVSQSELRALKPEQRAGVVALRDAYEAELEGLLAGASANAGLKVTDPKLAVYAIIAIGQQVGRWYRPDGRLTLAEISLFYQDFLLDAIGARGLESPAKHASRRPH
jgi:AcrR family transcriptional regulator